MKWYNAIMKKIVIIYKENHYVISVNTEHDYFYYALHLRDLVNGGMDIEIFLKEAVINNDVKTNDVDGFYKIESNKTYFYEYAFEVWECANDYKEYEDHTDEMLATMPYIEIDGVKYY